MPKLNPEQFAEIKPFVSNHWHARRNRPPMGPLIRVAFQFNGQYLNVITGAITPDRHDYWCFDQPLAQRVATWLGATIEIFK